MCNLGPFENHFAFVREKISGSEKARCLVAKINALKTEDEIWKMKDHPKGDFDIDCTLAVFISLVERHDVAFNDAAQGAQSSEVKGAIHGCLQVLAELIEPVMHGRMKANWLHFVKGLGTNGEQDACKLPRLSDAMSSTEVGELKVMQPALRAYFGVISRVALNCGCDTRHLVRLVANLLRAP